MGYEINKHKAYPEAFIINGLIIIHGYQSYVWYISAPPVFHSIKTSLPLKVNLEQIICCSWLGTCSSHTVSFANFD